MELDEGRAFWGDIEDNTTYVHALKAGTFDGLMAMGVMPHVEKDDLAISNMATMLRPGGIAFIEFRNKLFSLFTFNRYTAEFILDDLLADIDPGLKPLVAKELEARLRMDLPRREQTLDDSGAPAYDAIRAKFHNPFEIVSVFERKGFRDIKLLWYHYHPAMPYLANQAPELFRRESLRLEHEPSGWRGYFLCSAFVVQAVKQ
jgi:SAM-dependent methyltransferase